MDIPLIPPGFESFVAMTLKRMEDDRVCTKSSSSHTPKAENIQLETQIDVAKTSTSLMCRTLIKQNHLDSSSNDQIELEEERFSKNSLPKGIIRGCEDCESCQKVIAKWRPEEARRLNLEEAIVFNPSEEEFEDTVKYISSIRSEAEKYGICRIVPPPSWTPPCPLKEKNIWERCKFTTRIQRIDKLQNRDTMRKLFQANHDKKKRRKCGRRGVEQNGIKDIKISDEADQFGFEPGPCFTLGEFMKYDDDFKAQYFRTNDISPNSQSNIITLEEKWNPTVKDIEGEYWRMVETPTEEIEVLYGADLDTGVFGSGFPKHNQVASASTSTSDLKHINSGWNLNNFPRLPGSVLSFENSDISGVMVPWLYIGMCFSSFCWHVEDHHMYSLNYMHWGAPKMWYGVPGSGAMKLEAAMKKHLPDLFEEQPDLLNKLVTQLSPSILRSEGVPVYRCVQNPGEFVLTFPRAYHAGFNCGFNCAEAVNIAPVDWLPHGQQAIEMYRKQGRRTTISHDKLLLSAAREAVKESWEHNLLRKYKSNVLRWNGVCGKDGILSKAVKTRVNMEQEWRESLSKSSKILKMESSFDASSEKECSVCLFDLHLSAAGCQRCSPHKYACLNHAKQLCSCSPSAKFFVFRFDIMELNMLVEALEGKLSAVYRWARLVLGLPLISQFSMDKKLDPGLMKVSHTPQESAREVITSPNVISSEVQKKQVNGGSLALTKFIRSVDPSQNAEPPMVVLALECVKKLDRSQKVKSTKSSPPCIRENSPPRKKVESFSGHKEIINLTDDDEEEEEEPPSKKLCFAKGASQKNSRSIQKPMFTDSMMNSDSCVSIKAEEQAEAESSAESSCINFSMRDKRNIDTNDYDVGKQIDDEKLNDSAHKNLMLDAELRSRDSMLAVSNPSSHLDRYHRQKGPRIARVIRRLNCNVEALSFGVVRNGKSWCDNHAIYPKGFRSRVRYVDVTDPTNTCYYISEILDAGLDRPLFMVSLETDPSEVFINVSPFRCWEMVRQRVNLEITKQHKLGRAKLPSLQPPGSVNGLQMFGFSSPSIMQAIEAMDHNHVCNEYWRSRSIIQMRESVDNTNVGRILDGLFQKANAEELDTLSKLAAVEPSLLNRLLSEKIGKLRR